MEFVFFTAYIIHEGWIEPRCFELHVVQMCLRKIYIEVKKLVHEIIRFVYSQGFHWYEDKQKINVYSLLNPYEFYL